MKSQATKQILTLLQLLILTGALGACGAPSHYDNQLIGSAGTGEEGGGLSRPIKIPPEADDCSLQGAAVSCEEFLKFGATFYEQNCTKCHDDLAVSEVRNRTMDEFNQAIAGRAKMRKFEVLADDERRAIITVLNQ